MLAVAPAPFGLPLPDRGGCAGAFEYGGGGAAAVFWAVGDVVVGGRSVLLKDGLSWGAGEGAMATAVLMALDVLLPRRR